jgi:GMP synthase-like glutamine amidotransferase
MRPIAILQHEAGVSAGHFASWLEARALPSVLVRVDRGAAMPASAEPFAGLCSLGGNMSVNDDLPWIARELALMRDALARGVPIIGHCLGGQLLARALGADVTRNACKEMGWLPVRVEDERLVREWTGAEQPCELFHWHGDAFDLPAGATRLFSSPLAPNQAFIAVRNGVEHLGMQFHVEMTAELVVAWAADPTAETEVAEERARTGGPGVQSPAEMCLNVERRTEAMRVLAWRLYDRWARGLRRD